MAADDSLELQPVLPEGDDVDTLAVIGPEELVQELPAGLDLVVLLQAFFPLAGHDQVGVVANRGVAGLLQEPQVPTGAMTRIRHHLHLLGPVVFKRIADPDLVVGLPLDIRAPHQVRPAILDPGNIRDLKREFGEGIRGCKGGKGAVVEDGSDFQVGAHLTPPPFDGLLSGTLEIRGEKHHQVAAGFLGVLRKYDRLSSPSDGPSAA